MMRKRKSHRSCRRDFIRQAGRVAGVAVVLGALPAAATATESQIHRADSIPVRLLGKTGVKLPILAYGGAALPSVWGNPLSHEDRVQLVRYAYDRGIRYFDTAGNYLESQPILGEALKGLRGNVFLTSKVEVTRAGKRRQAFEKILAELQTDHLDAILIHGTPGLEQMSVAEAMRVHGDLLKLRDEKMVRFIGFSAHGYFHKALALIESGGFDLCMLSYGYIPRGYDQIWSARMTALRDACVANAHELGMGILAMKVVGAGVLGAWSGYVVPGFDRQKLEQLPAAAIRHVLNDERVQLLTIGMRLTEEIDANIRTLNAETAYTAADRGLLAEVKQGLIEELLERSSPLEAEAQVQVLARTQNPAVELFVEEGDKVTQGQVLLRLESDRQQIDCDQAMNQVEKAQIDFDASEKLYREDLISEQAYRDIKHTFNQARLQAERAKRELEYTEVRAPINGTVTRRSIKVGDQVNLGTPLFEIVDFDSIVAVVHVPEQYLPKLKPNMEARLFSSTLGDEAFDGFVKRISPVVDAQAGTIKVVVGVSELGALRPGMWVDVELVLDSKPDAMLIPKRSIVYDNDQTYAFKASWDTNGVRIAQRQLVEPRNADKIHIEPQSGFKVGDLIVVAGQSGLKDDSPIRAQEQPEVAGQALTVPIAQSTTNAEPAVAKTTDQSVN